MLKQVLTLAILTLMGAGLVGCHAEGSVDDTDHDSSYKKTTTVHESDGDVHKTEVKRTTDR